MIYRFRSAIYFGLALLTIIGFYYASNYIEREGLKTSKGVIVYSSNYASSND